MDRPKKPEIVSLARLLLATKHVLPLSSFSDYALVELLRGAWRRLLTVEHAARGPQVRLLQPRVAEFYLNQAWPKWQQELPALLAEHSTAPIPNRSLISTRLFPGDHLEQHTIGLPVDDVFFGDRLYLVKSKRIWLRSHEMADPHEPSAWAYTQDLLSDFFIAWLKRRPRSTEVILVTDLDPIGYTEFLYISGALRGLYAVSLYLPARADEDTLIRYGDMERWCDQSRYALSARVLSRRFGRLSVWASLQVEHALALRLDPLLDARDADREERLN